MQAVPQASGKASVCTVPPPGPLQKRWGLRATPESSTGSWPEAPLAMFFPLGGSGSRVSQGGIRVPGPGCTRSVGQPGLWGHSGWCARPKKSSHERLKCSWLLWGLARSGLGMDGGLWDSVATPPAPSAFAVASWTRWVPGPEACAVRGLGPYCPSVRLGWDGWTSLVCVLGGSRARPGWP